MSIKKQKGFTLIELLVVIAIIGILSSVVLASLNTARGKGSDAAVKSAMSSLQAQAAIYYDGAGAQTYLNGGAAVTSPTLAACTEAGTVFTDPQAANIVQNIFLNGNASTALCTASSTAYTISVTLKGSGTSWCVDSNGNATTTVEKAATGLCI
jgi:prepilin-type N-terminal cleavage/methylation domain-containing protein